MEKYSLTIDIPSSLSSEIEELTTIYNLETLKADHKGLHGSEDHITLIITATLEILKIFFSAYAEKVKEKPKCTITFDGITIKDVDNNKIIEVIQAIAASRREK